MTKAGYIRGIANPCLFRHATKDVSLTVHGDDFVGVGSEEYLQEIKSILEKRYKITVEMLGSGKSDVQEVKILNRVIRWADSGILLEADPRHAEIIIEHYGLEVSKASKVLGSKPVKKESEETDEEEEDDEMDIELGPREAYEHRSVAARLNYLAVDRVDIQFATKELARTMAKPTRGDVLKAKKIGRYLVGVPRLVMTYRWNADAGVLSVYSDSDWAGCRKSRKST